MQGWESLAVHRAANHWGHAMQCGHGKSHVMLALKVETWQTFASDLEQAGDKQESLTCCRQCALQNRNNI